MQRTDSLRVFVGSFSNEPVGPARHLVSFLTSMHGPIVVRANRRAHIIPALGSEPHRLTASPRSQIRVRQALSVGPYASIGPAPFQTAERIQYCCSEVKVKFHRNRLIRKDSTNVGLGHECQRVHRRRDTEPSGGSKRC